ncbi:Hsp20 family protein [Bradyrhizobium sp. 150]|uniref:Hsp20 family protein n=1 Tax=Bradyrhizobium sp. 150 TaxID=2782625 RepID=UPI0031F6AA44|nr:Hsp20 family protein [Bradyrhizobium sp. 150]
MERSDEGHYQISLALAGFSPDEVTITGAEHADRRRPQGRGAHQFLYQGISSRPFRRQFNLAEYVQVKGASLVDGMLKIELVREVPQAMKPRQMAGNDNQKLEHQQMA